MSSVVAPHPTTDHGRQEHGNGIAPSTSPVAFGSPSRSPSTSPMFTLADLDSPFVGFSPTTSPRPTAGTISTPRQTSAQSSPQISPTPSPRTESPPTDYYTIIHEDEMPSIATTVAVTPLSAPSTSSSAGPAAGMSNITFHARKKGGHVKNWKDRYWLFEPAGGMLSYYEDQTLKVRKGYVDLSQCKAIGPVRHERIPHTLGLRTKDRLWVLAFDNASEMGRIQTLLGSVVQGFLEAQDVPVSTLTKLKRGFTKKTSKSHSPASPNDKDKSRSASPIPTSSNSASHHQNGKNHEESHKSVLLSHSEDASRAAANEKAALSSLNQNLTKIRGYTGKEFTLECDMSIVRARLESDHPEKKDIPGDIIYAGFMGALASKFQELCDYHLYREVINHKCSGRIAIRVSDEDADRRVQTPFLRLDAGTLVIVCHRSLLTSSLIELGDDFLDVLSIGEPLHIAALKDIEDHKQGIKSSLIKIQSNLGVTCQFECDYTEGFRTLASVNPSLSIQCSKSWGEIIYKYLDAVTSRILKNCANPTAKVNFAESIPNRSIRITVVISDPENRPAWVTTDGGSLNVFINASNFGPEKPITMPTW